MKKEFNLEEFYEKAWSKQNSLELKKYKWRFGGFKVARMRRTEDSDGFKQHHGQNIYRGYEGI